MMPRNAKIAAVTFVALTAAMAINLVSLQPLGGRLASRTAGDRAAQKSAQALALALEDGKAAGAAADAKLKTRPEPRTGAAAADNSKTAAAPPRANETGSTGDGPDTIRALQRELQARGYEAGTVDGVPGLITRAAILAYEFDHAMPMTGEPTERLLKQILLGELQPGPATNPTTAERTPQAEQVIRTVQQSLINAGYTLGKPDGRMGEETVRAIREFETDQGLPETGRVSGQLVGRLARLAGQGRLTTTR